MSSLRVISLSGLLFAGTALAAGSGWNNDRENCPEMRKGMGNRMANTEIGMGRGMHRGDRQGAEGPCLSLSNITKEQADKIAAIHKDFDPKREKIRTEMRDLRIQLRDLTLSKAGPDKTKPVEQKIESLREEKFKLATEVHAKIQAVITPKK